MQTVVVTGATGFIGRHVVDHLRRNPGIRLIVSGRDEEALRAVGTRYAVYDLNDPDAACFDRLGRPDLLLHLAWEGLPNYQSSVHMERNLPNSRRFLEDMVRQGLRKLIVAGTCYEYGLQDGCLTEAMPALPATSYGIAKNALRCFLEDLQVHFSFHLCWVRLFFMCGRGQAATSLLSQLDRAIADGAEEFDMSGGEQLRDYLPVEKVADLMAAVALQDRCDGIFNVCSGEPISVRRLVEEHMEKRGRRLRLNLGVYPYPKHEPMAFWGDVSGLRAAIAANEEKND